MRASLVFCLVPVLLDAVACGADVPRSTSTDLPLTSLTARERALSFEGVVYVEPGASDAEILETARAQTRSAFGALLHLDVAVQTREVGNIDERSFKKRKVTVIDPDDPRDEGRAMTEVTYEYRDNAVVPVAMARKTSLPTALLGPGAKERTQDLVFRCTAGTAEEVEDERIGLFWYDFNPSLERCRAELAREQRAIDADTAKLADPKRQVAASRANRTFLPVTMRLAAGDNAKRATYPEYDRLFGGASEEGVLTIVLLNGRLSHDGVEASEDYGYHEWMAELGAIFAEHPDFELTTIEPREDITSAEVNGVRYDDLRFDDFIRWQLEDEGPHAYDPSRDELQRIIADRLDNHWITFEKRVKVAIGDQPPKPLTIRIETLFGVDDEMEPHRRALRRGDVLVYDGHSFIGDGPLDPANYDATSFTNGYQLLWFDSCVSYNYYEKDYFSLKPGGSKNLDLITNGLEAPQYLSGDSEGKLIAKLIGGSMPSYRTLLEAASATDALRVVDGELDNEWTSERTRVKLLP